MILENLPDYPTVDETTISEALKSLVLAQVGQINSILEDPTK